MWQCLVLVTYSTLTVALPASDSNEGKIWFQEDALPGKPMSEENKGGWMGNSGFLPANRFDPTESTVQSGSGTMQGGTGYGGTMQGGTGYGGTMQGGTGYGGTMQGGTGYGGSMQGGGAFGESSNSTSSNNNNNNNTSSNNNSNKPGNNSYSQWQFMTKRPIVALPTYRPQMQQVQPTPWTPSPEVVTSTVEIARALDGFALDIHRAMDSSSPNKIFSPLSIASAMALVMLGARGRTKTELASLFGVNPTYDFNYRIDNIHRGLGAVFKKLERGKSWMGGVEISIANGLFVDDNYPVNSSYIDRARALYDSQVESLDFQQSESSRNFINKWVSDRTASRIQNLIPEPLSTDTRVVIANAIYFNGEWEHQFLVSSTKPRPFYVTKTEIVDVPMMVNTAEVYYGVDKMRGYRTLGLPYKGSQMFLFIVIPDQDLSTFVKTMTPKTMHEIVTQTSLQQLIFTVPRMRLESSLSMKKTLENLGVTSMFDSSGDLSGIAPGVRASQVFHKVQIEVTETGTVAAAATSVTLTRDGSIPIFRVDHPFLFFMYHAPTETTPFWGTVTRPTPNTPHSYTRRSHHQMTQY